MVNHGKYKLNTMRLETYSFSMAKTQVFKMDGVYEH